MFRSQTELKRPFVGVVIIKAMYVSNMLMYFFVVAIRKAMNTEFSRFDYKAKQSFGISFGESPNFFRVKSSKKLPGIQNIHCCHSLKI